MQLLLVLWDRTTHFDVKLHFGDEQFEVDAAQLPIAFTQVTLWVERETKEANMSTGTKGPISLVKPHTPKKEKWLKSSQVK